MDGMHLTHESEQIIAEEIYKNIKYLVVRGIKYKKIEHKLKDSLIGISENNILEIGCGSKIYKKIFLKHSYYGLININLNGFLVMINLNFL